MDFHTIAILMTLSSSSRFFPAQISSWMAAHELKLNPSKTELLFILGDASPCQDLVISLDNPHSLVNATLG